MQRMLSEHVAELVFWSLRIRTVWIQDPKTLEFKNVNTIRASGVLRGFTRAVNGILGGSWLVIIGVISPLISVITMVILLITLLITSHEPPSTGAVALGFRTPCIPERPTLVTQKDQLFFRDYVTLNPKPRH